MLGSVTVWGIYTEFQNQAFDRTRARAELVADAVNYAAESVSRPGELQRIVSAMGAEEEVSLIIVVGGHPARVLATTRNVWLGKTLAELSGLDAHDNFEKILQTRVTHHHIHRETSHLDFVTPLLLSQPELAERSLTDGVVLVRLDISTTEASMRQLAIEFSIAFVTALGLLAALGYGMIHRLVLHPIYRISKLVEHRQKGNGENWAEAATDDELGALAHALDDSLTLTESTLHELEEQRNTLRQAEARYRLLFEQSPDGIVILDPKTARPLEFNETAHRQLGYSREEFARLSISDFENIESPEDTMAHIAEVIREGRSDFETQHCTRQGEIRNIHVTAQIIEGLGNPLYHCIWRDITERKRAEAELVQHRDHLEELVFARTAELAHSRDDAEAANRAKSIFLANMSHELRTPMNGVMGMIDLVLRRATDPKQIDWLNKSKTSAQHLLAVIDDILDISKMESDRLTLEEKNFSLSQAIDDTLRMQDALAQAKGLRLSREIDPALPDLLCGDSMRLRQILINYIGNAIKFSERGQIIVRAQAVEEDNISLLLRVEVTDQGIGISPEQQSRLFHAFTQADGSTNRKYGGTGLGLIISKRIAQLMGGDAGVISEEGQGSTFWVTVKLRKGVAVAIASPTENVDAETLIRERYSGRFILVVDDEPMNLEIARMQLEAVDLVVDTAEDVAEAIALARQNSYAAIFMDMQMPNVNGLDATQQIRELPGYRQTRMALT